MRDWMEVIFPGRLNCLGNPGRRVGAGADRQTEQVMKNVWSSAAASPAVPWPQLDPGPGIGSPTTAVTRPEALARTAMTSLRAFASKYWVT